MAAGVILSLGSINVDLQMRADRWPDPEETLLGHDFAILGGGKAANVAFLAHRLGHESWLLAHVGDDVLAEQALSPLRAQGVVLDGVRRVHGAYTGVAMIVVHPGGHKGILLAGNANDTWDADATEDAVRRIASAPEGSVLTVDFEVPPAVAATCMEQARGHGLRVVLDPSPAERVSMDALRWVDALTPNQGEAERLTRMRITSRRDAEIAARKLCEAGAGATFVKLDDGGCVWSAGRDVHHVPIAHEIPAVDTTGAGDAFTGALAVALLEGQNLEDAARDAVTCASLAVRSYGSQPAYPDRRTLRGQRTSTVGPR